MRINMELLRSLIRRRVFVTLPLSLLGLLTLAAFNQPTMFLSTPTGSNNRHHSTTILKPVTSDASDDNTSVLGDGTTTPSASPVPATYNTGDNSSQTNTNSVPSADDTPSQPTTTPTYACDCALPSSDTDSTLYTCASCSYPTPSPCGTCGGYKHPGMMCAMYCMY
jgi:hypothetical protein